MVRLRDKMTEDLRLRGRAPITIRAYVRWAQRFSEHFGVSPARLGEGDVRAFVLYQVEEKGLSPSTHAVCLAALKFLYSVTLDRPEVVARIPFPKVAVKLPEILSGSEVQRLLGCVTSIRCRVICTLAYGAGLRVTEACRLKPGDIDAGRGLVHVRGGKGSRDREVVLGKKLLELLREYWKIARPEGGYLFPGHVSGEPITRQAVYLALKEAARAARIRKRVTPHILRHSFATHLLEMGANLRTIQVVLGHSQVGTTVRYVRVARGHIAGLTTPLDVLGTKEGEILG